MFQTHNWQRDARNPIFKPQEPFDIAACMNPCVLRREDEYWMFYAGGAKDGSRRICLATCKVDNLTNWKRLGPLFDLGPKDAFDDSWCVLPCVHRFRDKWHLYYTGRSSVGEGLQAFAGIGLATSSDLLNWKKADGPVLRGDGFEKWPTNHGVAGGGSISESKDAQGNTVYKMNYTLAVGTPSKDTRIDQEKHAVCAHSHDGLSWFDKKMVLSPRPEVSYEDAASGALNAWQEGDGFRAIYAVIGTRFGAYAICEAQSDDGNVWNRGVEEENLALAPREDDGDGWASQMCEYPNVVEENGKLRLFYCGNGYGKTGIGTALAEKLVNVGA